MSESDSGRSPLDLVNEYRDPTKQRNLATTSEANFFSAEMQAASAAWVATAMDRLGDSLKGQTRSHEKIAGAMTDSVATLTNAVNKQTESQARSSESIEGLTRAYVNATKAIAWFTAVLALVAIAQVITMFVLR